MSDPVAEDWDNRTGQEGDWFQKCVLKPVIIALLGHIKGLKILDTGCGNGHLSRDLARAEAVVTGIDISKELIVKAQQYSRSEQLNIQYFHADLTKPLNLKTKFDHIVSNMVIQDIDNYLDLLRNFKKLLSHEGSLIISTRHPCFSPSMYDLGWLLTLTDSSTILSGPGLSHLESYRNFKGNYLKMDYYFNKTSFTKIWGESSTVSFPRTLQDYSLALCNTGFVITKILEPLPTAQGESEWPDMANLLRRIPHFIIFSGQHARE